MSSMLLPSCKYPADLPMIPSSTGVVRASATRGGASRVAVGCVAAVVGCAGIISAGSVSEALGHKISPSIIVADTAVIAVPVTRSLSSVVLDGPIPQSAHLAKHVQFKCAGYS